MVKGVDLNNEELELLSKLKTCLKVRSDSDVLRQGLYTLEEKFLNKSIAIAIKGNTDIKDYTEA